jgi:hypothetical protein
MMKSHLICAVAGFATALVLTGLTGCSSKLDTGYEPRKLGASDETRRGFYAQPFTPEAKAAKQYEQDFGDVRRPRPGY